MDHALFILKVVTHYYAIAPLVIAGIIAAASSIIGSIVKSKADSNANTATMQYNEAAYGRQRSDALADWQMQTEYNSPTSQMARLREAGLNPILAAGNITTTSPSVRSSDFQSYQAKPVDISPGILGLGEAGSSTLLSAYDVQLKTAQLDNLKAQNTVIAQDAALKAAQTVATLNSSDKTNVDIQSTQFDLGQRQRLADTSAEMATQQLAKLKADTTFTLDSNERAAASNSMSLKEAMTRILKMKAEQANTETERKAIESKIRGLDFDNELKQLDIKLRKIGIQPGDNMFNRMLQKLLDGMGIAPGGSLLNGAREFSHKVDSTAKKWFGKSNTWHSGY